MRARPDRGLYRASASSSPGIAWRSSPRRWSSRRSSPACRSRSGRPGAPSRRRDGAGPGVAGRAGALLPGVDLRGCGSGARPRRDRQARTLLDDGARRIDAELAREPELHAELLELLAGLYRKLGELEPAKSLAERALAEHRRLFGDESAQTARSEWTLGWVLANQGDFAPARERLEHAIAVLDREEGPESLTAADAREPLMELLFGAEGPRGALPVIERRLATYRAVLGERDVRTALSLSDFGVVVNELGRTAEAERAYRASAAILDALLPAGDPRVAYPHSNLAGLLRESGRLPEAEIEARKALATRRKALGDHHPEIATTLGQLSRILLELGRFPEAEATAHEALAVSEGRDRFNAAQSRALLASVLLKQGKAAGALALFEQCVVEHRALLPPDHVLNYSDSAQPRPRARGGRPQGRGERRGATGSCRCCAPKGSKPRERSKRRCSSLRDSASPADPRLAPVHSGRPRKTPPVVE